MARSTLAQQIPSVTDMAARIVAAYGATDAATRRDGRAWYSEAQTIAREVADTLGVSTEVGAGIVAAYSAGTAWSVNVRMARATAALGEPVPHRFGGSRKVRAMLEGAAPANVITGAKLSAFFRTIADPDATRSTVVVDRHAFAVATGRASTEAQRFLNNDKIVDAIAEAYRVAATIVGERPGHLQAIVWIPVALDTRNK